MDTKSRLMNGDTECLVGFIKQKVFSVQSGFN